MNGIKGRIIRGSKLFLNTCECAELIGRSPGAVRNLVMRRKIPFRKVGGRLVFVQQEVESWILNGTGVRLDELEDP